MMLLYLLAMTIVGVMSGYAVGYFFGRNSVFAERAARNRKRREKANGLLEED